MKRGLTRCAAGAIALACVAPAALAESGPFSFALRASADPSVSGDVHSGAILNVPNVGALPSAIAGLSGVPGVIGVESRAFDDIYDNGWTLGAELGYAYSDALTGFVSLDYTTLDDGEAQVGTVNVPALGATLPLRGEFGSYDTLALQVGARYRLAGSGAAWQPFVGGRLGVVQIEEIDARFFVPFQGANAVNLTGVPFYDDTTTFTGGLDLGVDYNVSDAFAMGLIATVQYTDAPDDVDSALGGLGLAGINDDGERWSIPVGVRAVFRY